ncbi:MAG: hypothetical protein GY913_11560 [Proteobacteria bacterium]|nr:hypothetical protein [Pseudomonadota bacterium]MCP4917551.1 hypothetical protein [Pseudomonadota bacterium]
MLVDPQSHDQPFRFVTASPAFSEAFCQELSALFDDPSLTWTEHRTFYEASISDVTHRVRVPQELIDQLADLLDVPLTSHTQVTAQRMVPGQFAEPHTDRPLLGYESVRVVLQLNRSWTRGGELVLGDTLRPPRWNSAFAFVLHPGAVHAIRTVEEERHTIVFHFWHAANTLELAEAVAELFEGLSFAGLGDFDAPEMSEEESHEAGCIAWCCRQWGRDDPAAQALARYLTRLRRQEFDPLAERVPPGTGLPIEALAYPV